MAKRKWLSHTFDGVCLLFTHQTPRQGQFLPVQGLEVMNLDACGCLDCSIMLQSTILLACFLRILSKVRESHFYMATDTLTHRWEKPNDRTSSTAKQACPVSGVLR